MAPLSRFTLSTHRWMTLPLIFLIKNEVDTQQDDSVSAAASDLRGDLDQRAIVPRVWC